VGVRNQIANRLRGRRRYRRASGGRPLDAALVTGLVALLLAGTVAALAVLHPGAASMAARAVTAAAIQAGKVPGPISESWLRGHPQPALPVHGEAVILVDADANQVLWEHSPHERRAPASLTKLMTAMVAADLEPLGHPVRVTGGSDADAIRAVEPTSTLMGLDAGELLSVRDLMYGMFLRSGNDAAETLGESLVGRDAFVRRMNQKAASLRMADSHFTSPIGLDDPAMRSSPYDLAIAAGAIVRKYPALLEIAGTPSITLPRTATHKEFAMTNYNKLVLPGGPFTYPGATGMKTAYTDEAGQCMVATATRGGRHLVAVVMDSDYFFTDAIALLNYGFSTPAIHR
jgi:D-alanyl-D-alanine carboxypeptidase